MTLIKEPVLLASENRLVDEFGRRVEWRGRWLAISRIHLDLPRDGLRARYPRYYYKLGKGVK